MHRQDPTGCPPNSLPTALAFSDTFNGFAEGSPQISSTMASGSYRDLIAIGSVRKKILLHRHRDSVHG